MNVETKEVILRGRLDGKQRNRLKRLLNMLYTPSELARELEISTDQIYRVYIPLGCPHHREGQRHIQINGAEFQKWYLSIYQKAKIQEDETFCKTCCKAVKIFQPITQQKNGLSYILSTCPTCGRKLTRIIDCKKGKHD